MKKIVVLTGSELRHNFFRRYLASCDEFKVINTYCEGLEKSLRTVIETEIDKDLRLRHLGAREQSEKDFFEPFVVHSDDRSNPMFLPKGEINSPETIRAITASDPDLLIAYGCSIVREPLLSAFAGRFLNVHLGLSPYYRGSGTNFWPLVNGEPEYVGATFMHIDAGIDTGEIIHQIRARVHWGDTPAQIGNRLILDMSNVYTKIIINFDKLERMHQPIKPSTEKVYKKKDYSEASVLGLYEIFQQGLVGRYLAEEKVRCGRVPIIRNPAIEG